MRQKDFFNYVLKQLSYYDFNSRLKIVIFRIFKQFKLKFIDLSKSRTLDVNGYKISTIPYDKGISAELIMFRIHEPLTTKILLRELKEEMVCLDVGSNIGYYVFLESNAVGDSGKVFAIEPSPQGFKALKKNLGLQNKSNIELHNFACGDKEGQVSFITTNMSNLDRINDENADSVLSETVNKVNINLRTIDDFVSEKKINKVDLIRFDTEGYELKIYEGMHQTLKNFSPILSFELHRSILGIEKTIKLLKALQNDGYEIKYYIPRLLDHPIIGKMKHVKNYTINEVVSMLERDAVPGTVGLLVVRNRQ